MRGEGTRAASLAALLVLGGVVAGCGSGGAASGSGGGARVLEVSIGDAGCDPAAIETRSGPVTFRVSATGGGRVTEFEVMKGDRILGEAENIAPGLRKEFSLTLQPGDYTTYCPNGTSSERGTLTVSGEAVASGRPDLAQRAVARYRSYLEGQTASLVTLTRRFAAAVDAGDVAEAKRLFPVARTPYERIEPVAESFGDLDPRIDAREGDVPAAGWTGFHRLEKLLWTGDATTGAKALTAGLSADVLRLQELVETVDLQPAQIANGAKELLDEVATSKITGEEDRYSHTDLWDFAANVGGARAAYLSVRPLLRARDAGLAARVDAQFANVARALAPYRSEGGGFVSYDDLTNADTRRLARAVDALAEPLSLVAAAVNA